MKRIFGLALGLILLVLLSAGCKDGLTEHNIDLDGAEHGKKLYQGAKDCTACHGITLQGNGWIPGCYDCHGVMWNNDDHKSDRGGVMHKRGFQATSDCGECHGGTALTGKRSRPGCYDCHGDKWSDLSMHNTDKSGYMHGENLFTPETYCKQCHGGDELTGENNRPGCYDCHYNKWMDKGSHGTMVYGVGHNEQFRKPGNDCRDCHGPTLRGTKDAPSCYLCHGQEWDDSLGKIQPK